MTVSRDSAPVVTLHDVAKQFRLRRGWGEMLRAPLSPAARVTGLDGVSLAVRERELFGVLGPNGAGKSTLFRILGTYLTPDRGAVIVHGLDVLRQPREVQRLVACVMANERAINWRLSARENLRLHAALLGIARLHVASRVQEAIGQVQLEAHAERPVGQLSTGLRQRVLIARALLARPRVLLLDEPTRGLDPMAAQALRTLVRDVFISQLGCTVLLATHDGDEAFHWCDRVAILHKGRVVATDRAQALAQRFGDALMGVWSTEPHHPAFDELQSRGLVHALHREPVVPPDATPDRLEAWQCVRLEMPNGPAAAADVLQLLTARGVPVSRFERLDASLAALIERAIAQGMAS